MRRVPTILSALACVALLTMQALGIHLHADVGDHRGEASPGIHVEQALSSEHLSDSHEGHVDLSLFDLSGFSNIDLAVHDTHTWSQTAISPNEVRWFLSESTAPPRGFSKLRPPLRAPPANA